MRMNRRVAVVAVSTVLALLAGGAAAVPATAADIIDTTAPVLASLQLVPPTADVTHGPADPAVLLRVTDDVTGFTTGSVTLEGPGGFSSTRTFDLDGKLSGTKLDAFYSLYFSLPQGAAAGAYTVADVTLTDLFANTRHYTHADAVASATLTVSRTADASAPALVGSLTATPNAVNTTQASREVVVSANLTDPVAGVTQATVTYTGPDLSTQSAYLSLTAGTANNGTWSGSTTFPVNSAPGAWTATALEVTDGYGNTAIRSTSLGGTVTVTSSPDTAGPTLTSLSVAPVAVDTTKADKVVKVTLGIDDAVSGFAYGQVMMATADGTEAAYGYFSSPDARTGGTVTSGTYSVDVTIPVRSQSGPWTITNVYLYDAYSNSTNLAEVDGDLAAFPSRSVTVTSTPDTTGPALGAFTLLPGSVNVHDGSQVLSGYLTVTDDVSGFSFGSLEFKKPGGSPSADIYASIGADDAVTGDGMSGTYRVSVYVPKGAAVGAWTVDKVTLTDVAQNTRTYANADLTGGLASGFTVTDTAGDTTKPVLTGLSAAPTSVNTTTGQKTVVFTVTAQDPGAGASGITSYGSNFTDYTHVTLTSPTGGRSLNAYFGPDDLVSGSTQDGTYRVELTVPAYTESGTWKVTELVLVDAAGNVKRYLDGDLAADGRTTTVAVTALSDVLAPQLVSRTVDSAAVNSASGPAPFGTHWTFTDPGGSGLQSLTATLSGPAGEVQYGSGTIPDPSTSGISDVTFFMPQYATAGTWTVTEVTLNDEQGNERVYTASDLTALGLGTSMVLTPAPDNAAPTASALSVVPSPLDTTAGPTSASVLVHLVDAASGVGNAELHAVSPLAKQSLTAPLDRVVGDEKDGWYLGTLDFPQYVDAGSWKLDLAAGDNKGNDLALTSAQLIAASMPGTLAVTGPADTVAPALTTLTISPTTLDTSTGAHPVTVDLGVTDADSGVAEVSFSVVSPTSTLTRYATKKSGSATNGVWESVFTVPAYSPTGTWTLDAVTITDVFGNVKVLSHADLVTAGVSHSFTVTGTPDTTAPTASALTIDPTGTIDVTAGSRSATATVTVADAGVGFSDGSVVFRSPGGTRSISAYFDSTERISGTATNGVYAVPLVLPRYAPAGTWTLTSLLLSDSFNNERTYAAADLVGAAFTTSIPVADATPDIAGPVLAGVSYSPGALDVSAAPGSLSVRLHVTDPLSGFASGSFSLRSPSGQDVRSVDITPANRLAGGTAQDGTYAVSIPFVSAVESGAWTLTPVFLTDAAGNDSSFSGAEVPAPRTVSITGVPTVPAAPTGVGGFSRNSAASVYWTAPSNGGSPVTGYKIEKSSNAGATWSVAVANTGSASTSALVSGLTNGTPYLFRVSAVNAVGTGAPSGASSAVTPAPTAPGAPAITTATPGNTTVALAWSAPTDNGGSPITGYRVRTSTTVGNTQVSNVLVTGTSTTVTGLTNNTAYDVEVAAVNAIGTGDFDFVGNVVPLAAATVAGAPTGVGAVLSGTTGAQVSWTAPASNGGAAITGYVVTPFVGATAQPALAVLTGNVLTTLVPGLSRGVTYTFKVAAVNAKGTGAQSAASADLLVPAGPPAAPGTPTAVAGDGTATVSWTAPASDGGSAVTGYKVTPHAGATSLPAVAVGAVLSTPVTGLANGTAYTFTVVAVNAKGDSPASAPSAAVTPRAPVALTFLAVPASGTYLKPAVVRAKVVKGGTTTGVAGVGVQLKARPSGTTGAFVVVATGVSNALGVVSFTTFKPTRSVQLQLGLTPSAAVPYVSALGSLRTLPVTQVITAKAAAAKVVKGKLVKIGGTVNPRKTGKVVTLQVKQGARWISVSNAKLTAKGTYAFAVKAKAKGAFTYRVITKADASFALSASAPVVVRVR